MEMKNFMKHAEQVGLITALIEGAFTYVTSVDMHYDENGCLHSTSF